MADLDEVAGQHMLKETAEELQGRERGDTGLAVFTAAVTETDGVGIGGEDMARGKRHPIDVPGEVQQSLLPSADRFGVNDPGLLPDLGGD